MPNMFDKLFICKDKFRNVKKGDEIIGFQVGIKVSYFRGVTLATVNKIQVNVDGVEYPNDQMTFTISKGTFTFDEMVGRDDVRWEFGEVALVTVKKPGGLEPGMHKVHVYEEIRVVNGMYVKAAPFFADWTLDMPLQHTYVIPTSKINRGICLYSYQEEYYLGKFTLEDCFRETKKTGATGVEIVSQATIPNYPNPPQNWVDEWFRLLDKYELTPSCYDLFIDGQVIDGEDISEDYAVNCVETDIKLAARLGFHHMRVVYHLPLAVLKRALPCAEKYDVRLGLEVHVPFTLSDPWLLDYVDYMKKSGTKHFGIIPDFGIFVKETIPLLEKKALLNGARKEAVQCVHDCYSARKSYEEALEALSAMNPTEVELNWANQAYNSSFRYCDPELLKEFIPLIIVVHAKVYDMQDGIDPSIPTEEIINILKDCGWSGYINTEYEGQRYYHDIEGFDRDHVELVAQHQAMLKRYLGI